jgi:hypothetical protein
MVYPGGMGMKKKIVCAALLLIISSAAQAQDNPICRLKHEHDLGYLCRYVLWTYLDKHPDEYHDYFSNNLTKESWIFSHVAKTTNRPEIYLCNATVLKAFYFDETYNNLTTKCGARVDGTGIE